MTTLTVEVQGMTCQHCVASVTKEVQALSGVDDVSIEVVPDGLSTVTVTAHEELSRGDLVDAVAAAGYSVVGD
jgi:copper chaperone